MIMIDDTHKLMQDSLAPELRAIVTRLDSLEKRLHGVDKRFDRTDAKIDRFDGRFAKVDAKLEDLERKADRRHDEMMSAVAQMIKITMLQDRVARFESGSSSPQ